jgi:hypothetical protein
MVPPHRAVWGAWESRPGPTARIGTSTLVVDNAHFSFPLHLPVPSALDIGLSRSIVI